MRSSWRLVRSSLRFKAGSVGEEVSIPAQPELDLSPAGRQPPVGADGGLRSARLLSIRRHRLHGRCPLHDLVDLGTLDDADVGRSWRRAVRAQQEPRRLPEAMNSGKTTLVRALASARSQRRERVRHDRAGIRARARLRCGPTPGSWWRSRRASANTRGRRPRSPIVPIWFRRALRMNADRVIVGEVLGDESAPHAQRHEPGTVRVDVHDPRGFLCRCVPTDRVVRRPGSRAAADSKRRIS
jgi:hypothetical protein